MKTLLSSLLAVLLCGSAFAAEVTTLADAKKVIVADFNKKTAELITLKIKGTYQVAERTSFTLVELARHASDRRSEWHAKALKKIRMEPAFAQALTKARADVVALPATAETRTFVAQVLDPVIKGLAAPANDAFIGDLARLHAALAPAK